MSKLLFNIISSCLLLVVLGVSVSAQSSTATLSGTVEDERGAVIPGANVTVVNDGTGARRITTTNENGSFTFPLLPASTYTVTIAQSGFATVQIPDLVLNVADQKAIQVALKVGDVNAAIEVRPDPLTVKTDGSVGTVVDRQFVENMPLSGRSFQALLALTPGVVQTRATNSSEGGQFSVNGQRTNANYFLVDGVGANAGIVSAPFNNTLPGQAGSGSLPALTALGGTNGLVPVDALQEFHVQTSSYAAEFGRMPGAQISMVTRSGTNRFHGSVFEYFRHDALDANDWFANREGLPKPELRQHDFGGVLGGPIVRNRLFFFGSYEGLRLLQPQVMITQVPSLERRQAAVPELKPYLNAFPLPNGADLGDGLAQFSASYSDPSSVNSTAVRVDYTSGGRFTAFARFSHSPSYTRARQSPGLAFVQTTNQNNTSFTAGLTWNISTRLVHDIRANYTRNDAPAFAEPDDFEGAVPPPLSVFGSGLEPDNSLSQFSTGSTSWSWGRSGGFLQRQINIVDSLTYTTATHDWKFGVDYRRVNPQLGGREIGFEFLSVRTANYATGIGIYQRFLNDPAEHAVAFDNLSLYVQDHWRPTRRMTLTYGLRWEWVPPPHPTEGGQAVTLDNLDDPYGGRMQLAPVGTPLWESRFGNFAPRIGISYRVFDKSASQLVLRAGAGMFYDLGYGQVASAYRSYPYTAVKTESIRLPLTAATRTPPRLGVDRPSELWVIDRDLELPVTYQWNVTADQSLGAHQTLTVSYVGATARRLLKLDRYNVRLLDWPTSNVRVNVNRNRGYSNYEALQVQFQRRLSDGLQTVASYTLSRARDTSSSEVVVNIPGELLPPEADYGYADFDVRHVMSAAVTYQLPRIKGTSFLSRTTQGWGVDLLVRARSGFPMNITTSVPFPPETVAARPNLIPGVPVWIDDPNAPGGRRLNTAIPTAAQVAAAGCVPLLPAPPSVPSNAKGAFCTPPPGTQGNLPRGAIRGFGAWQADVAIRRDFRLSDRTALQIRGELFNVLNTPNFSDPTTTVANVFFGITNQMLNRGLGGLNALYQLGGPRSAQLSVKLTF